MRWIGLVVVSALKTLSALSTLGALSVLCAGCNDKSQSKSDAGSGAVTSTLAPDDVNKVLAKVGDRTITLGDYASTLEHMNEFERMRYSAPERRKELLREMINVELLAKEAEEKGYTKDPLAQEEERAILRDAILQRVRAGAPAPTDLPLADVRAYYDAHRADFRDPERRRLSLLVLNAEDAANSTLEKAKTANPVQWGDLVKQKSVDAQAKANLPVELAGDFGFVSPPGDPRGANARIPEEVRAAGFQIEKVGEVYPKVVKALGKFYIVRLFQKTDARDREFAEAERVIRVTLAEEKVKAKEAALLSELRSEFNVTIDEEALKTVQIDWANDAGAKGPKDPGK